MDNTNIIDLAKRLLSMNEMLDVYAAYPPSEFFVKQVQRKKDICSMLDKAIARTEAHNPENNSGGKYTGPCKCRPYELDCHCYDQTPIKP